MDVNLHCAWHLRAAALRRAAAAAEAAAATELEDP
jgi:hypothetical protein